jgi:rod shape-determining protein MreC
VLLIDDQTSGVGAILDKTRLQGILRGTPSGEVVLEKVMSDETVPAGELVLTSGGDGIFPKGLLVGRVTKVSPGSDLFLNIRVRPAADLSRLEEVLVVTKIDERQAEPDQTGAARAVDILAERLPGVPSKPEMPSRGAGNGRLRLPRRKPDDRQPLARRRIAKRPPKPPPAVQPQLGSSLPPAPPRAPPALPSRLPSISRKSSASHASNQAAATGADAGKFPQAREGRGPRPSRCPRSRIAPH